MLAIHWCSPAFLVLVMLDRLHLRNSDERLLELLNLQWLCVLRRAHTKFSNNAASLSSNKVMSSGGEFLNIAKAPDYKRLNQRRHYSTSWQGGCFSSTYELYSHQWNLYLEPLHHAFPLKWPTSRLGYWLSFNLNKSMKLGDLKWNNTGNGDY